MGSEQARNLRRQGIAAAKAGQKDQARALLQQSIRLEPDNEAAWIWLASIARDQRERLFCFQRLLEINPQNETALNALKAMGITPQQLSQSQQSASAPAAASQQPESAAQPAETRVINAQLRPGAPVPDTQSLANAQQQIDEIIRQVQRADNRIEGIEWVQKSRRRAGERDSLYLRLYVWAGALGILAAVLIIGGLVVWNTPSLRGIVFAPTWTPTFTPTLTPTNTPGFTPTPSPTPELTLTPSPTIDPDIPEGRIDAPPVPTRIYPELTNRRLGDAVALMNQGQYAVALPTLVKEREATELSFDAAPYYYEALALLGVGQADTALDRLSEAERRLSESRDPLAKPLLDTGFAQVHLQIAREAFASRNTSLALDELDATELRAEQAIEADPRLVPAYITLARRYELEDQYSDALKVVEDALSIPELKADINLLVERGEIYYQQNEPALAAQDAYTVLYIDPTIEQAYLLQIKVALDQGNPGLAVIYAQNYLFFYPGSAEGYRLLGDARRAEGNIDLALAAYDQALAPTEPTDATVPALTARADIYMQQHRYDLARQDYSRIFDLTDDPEIQAKRMEAAHLSGNLSVARGDAADLMGMDVVPDSQLELMQARIMVDESDANDTEALTEALGLLQTAGNAVPASLRPVTSEYLARAQFLLGKYADALRSIDESLTTVETGSGHFLRGQILEALEEPDQAIREYEWVLMWSEVYPYPFLPDARRRLRLLEEA